MFLRDGKVTNQVEGKLLLKLTLCYILFMMCGLDKYILQSGLQEWKKWIKEISLHEKSMSANICKLILTIS